MAASATPQTIARCPNCGVELDADSYEEWMVRDRQYFETHPGEKCYRRLALTGEHPFGPECSGRLMVVEVTAVSTGIRTRIGFEIAAQASGILQ